MPNPLYPVGRLLAGILRGIVARSRARRLRRRARRKAIRQWFEARIRARRRAKLGRMFRAELAVLDAEAEHLRRQLRLVDVELTAAREEISKLSAVCARDLIRVQAETAVGARIIGDARREPSG